MRPKPTSTPSHHIASRLDKERGQLVASLERELARLRATADASRQSRWPSARGLRAWQRTAAAQLTTLLGWPLVGGRPARVKPRWRSLGWDALGEIRLVRFGVTGHYGAFALLFVPERDQPAPLVIAQHGGLGLVEMISGLGCPTTNYHNLVTRLRQRGCAVLVPQLPMWSGRAKPSCSLEKLDARLQLLGGSSPALQTLTLRRALDAALGLPALHHAPVGLVGLSYGGCYGLYAAALDPRIQAVLSSAFFNDRHAYPLPPAIAAGAARSLLDAELGALVCPRALWIEVADRDELFSPKGARAEAAKLRRLYRDAGQSSRFRFTVFSGTHEFNRADAGLDFLVRSLDRGRTPGRVRPS